MQGELSLPLMLQGARLVPAMQGELSLPLMLQDARPRHWQHGRRVQTVQPVSKWNSPRQTLADNARKDACHVVGTPENCKNHGNFLVDGYFLVNGNFLV
jgi:hypothetical protein